MKQLRIFIAVFLVCLPLSFLIIATAEGCQYPERHRLSTVKWIHTKYIRQEHRGKYVVDGAGLIPDKTYLAGVNRVARSLRHKTGIKLTVITLNRRSSDDEDRDADINKRMPMFFAEVFGIRKHIVLVVFDSREYYWYFPKAKYIALVDPKTIEEIDAGYHDNMQEVIGGIVCHLFENAVAMKRASTTGI